MRFFGNLFRKSNEDHQEVAASAMGSIQARDDTGNYTRYGAFEVDNTNIFTKYREMSVIHPYVSQSLIKLGLTLTKGFEVVCKDERVQEMLDDWIDQSDIRNKIQNIARLTVQNGTCATYITKKKNLITLDILPMEYVTLLPKGIQVGSVPQTLLKGEIDRVVINERPSTEGTTVLKSNEVAVFRFFHEGYLFEDILGRKTYGLYGMSLLDPIDRPLKNLMDILDYYVKSIRRYGTGRLWIDFHLLEELARQGKKKMADNILKDAIAAQQNIKANEDILGYGFKVNEITGSAKDFDIVGIKKSLETDIQVGLMQSPLTMGESKGSTYAAGKVAEQDRIFVLKSMQEVLARTFERDVLDKYLRMNGIENAEVEVRFAELERRDVDTKDLIEAYATGLIERDEFRRSIGLPGEE